LQVTFIVAAIFGSSFKAPPLTYSLSSESTKSPYMSQDSILSQNQQIYGKTDVQVEVSMTNHYFKSTSLQTKQPYAISVSNPSFYEGSIWIDDLNAEMIENPDAEANHLTRWTDESDGIPDSSKIQRLNTTNGYGYTPSALGDNHFFLFNATSYSNHWFVDYFANQSIPSSSPLISFQYSNRFELLLSQKPNIDLHIRFDFLEFDVLFLLYTKISKSFNYNQTMGNERYVHFLLNNTWGPSWIDVRPINMTEVLLSLEMYKISDLPPLFHLNRISIECFASPPYQFHLLLDNLSLKTPIYSHQLEFWMNENRFNATGRDKNALNVNGFTEGDLNFQLTCTDGALLVPDDLNGRIGFDIWFRECLPLTPKFNYMNQTSITWIISFNITKKNLSFGSKTIEIRIPATWTLYTLQTLQNEEKLQECVVRESENTYLIEFYGDLVPGNWWFAAYAPNCIYPLHVSPTVVEQNSIVQLDVSLRSLRAASMEITLLRNEDNRIYFNTSQLIPLEGRQLNIPIGTDFLKGTYTITAKVAAGFFGGIQHVNIIVPTSPAFLIVDNPQSLPQYEPVPISVQMIDLTTRLNIDAEFSYTWDSKNESIILDNQSDASLLANSSQIYQIDTIGLYPGKHSLTIIGRRQGYPTLQETLNISIIPAILNIELEYPEKIYVNEVAIFKIRILNNFSHPAPGIDTFLRINDIDIGNAKTDPQGYCSMIWVGSTNASDESFVEVILFQNGNMVGNHSQLIRVEKEALFNDGVHSSIWETSQTFFASAFAFLVSTIVAIYRHQRSKHIILFDEGETRIKR